MDAKSYSSRSEVDHQELQRGIVAVADSAARAVGLHRESWDRQAGGDSEFAVLPTTESEVVVVDQYVRALNAELFRYNRRLRMEARLRLRVAVHFGPMSRAALGHAGQAPIAVARLVDSAVLRAALAEAEEANLALLLSERVYVDTVESQVTSWRPGQFRQVRVNQKEFDEDAWLWVPDHDVHAMALAVESAPAGQSNAPAGPSGASAALPERVRNMVQNNFNDEVHAEHGVFGMGFGAGS
jgi:hypothetical protein